MPNFVKDTQSPGRVIWITGLSGSGKTTLSREIVRQLREKRSDVISLDGDELRQMLTIEGNNTSFYDRKARLTFAMKYARLSKILSTQGFIVVIATISMFREIYDWNKLNLPGYFEVYLNVPIDELRRRNSKEIYSRFDAGELQYVAGLDLNVDTPRTPHLEVIHESSVSPSILASEVIRKSEIGEFLE